MKQFLYLFRGGDEGFANQSPEEMQAHMAKWDEWMQKIGQIDPSVSGLPLNNEGAVVTNRGEVITDGPYVEGKEIVGGYLLLKARDMKHAVELSHGCPIFDFDGMVEVRETVDY